MKCKKSYCQEGFKLLLKDSYSESFKNVKKIEAEKERMRKT